MKPNLFLTAALLVLLSIISIPAAGSILDLPADFPGLIIHKYGTTAPGVFIGYFGASATDYYVVLDESGNPLFYSKTAQMSYPGVMANGLISAKGYAYTNPSITKGYTLKDETFTVVDSFELVGNYAFDIHDFEVMPNGHAILLGSQSVPVDMSKIVSNGRPDAKVTDNVIQEIDTNKNVVFEWHSMGNIPIADSFFNLSSANIDYAHFNSVYIDPIDNNLLISFRTTSEIVKVSRSTGEIIWRLGGKSNQFTFIGEHAENAPYYFVGQHCIWRKTNGNLLFFDNGNIQGGGVTPCDRSYSRAVEYQIDETNKTATLAWEFRHSPDISTPSNGRVQPLSNGNVMIDWGQATSNTMSVPIATEVSPAGQVVYEMYFSSYTKGARLQKYIWNSPDLVKSQSFQNIKSGGTYNADTPGAVITVNSLTGKENNGIAIKRHADAVRFPMYSGKAPQVMIERVTMSVFGIDEIEGDLSFNIAGMDYKDPNLMTVYHRPYEGKGTFTPLATVYNQGTKKVDVYNAAPGEFIFTYPDVQGSLLTPVIEAPENLSTVSYALPVTFTWTQGGLFQSFHVQVAKDAEFNNIVADEQNITAFKYVMGNVEPMTTYFWRVCANNYDSVSEWATASFTAVAPAVKVITPNGGEQWHRGLTYFIQWEYNMDDSVAIDLYSGGVLNRTIATVSGVYAYEWEVDPALRPGDAYYIKVRRVSDGTISDLSDAPFSILK